jgi:DNA-binding Xre family transcriptional regulator
MMLKFNPRRVFRLRGINNDMTFMMKNGFIRSTASNLLNGHTNYVKDSHLEKLCLLLHCTPNDLFDWTPGKDTLIADDHPIHALKRGLPPKSVSEIVKDLPLDKLDKVESLLQQLKTE